MLDAMPDWASTARGWIRDPVLGELAERLDHVVRLAGGSERLFAGLPRPDIGGRPPCRPLRRAAPHSQPVSSMSRKVAADAPSPGGPTGRRSGRRGPLGGRSSLRRCLSGLLPDQRCHGGASLWSGFRGLCRRARLCWCCLSRDSFGSSTSALRLRGSRNPREPQPWQQEPWQQEPWQQEPSERQSLGAAAFIVLDLPSRGRGASGVRASRLLRLRRCFLRRPATWPSACQRPCSRRSRSFGDAGLGGSVSWLCWLRIGCRRFLSRRRSLRRSAAPQARRRDAGRALLKPSPPRARAA